MPDTDSRPRSIHGVMISSTSSGLAEHRKAAVAELKRQGLTDVAMENDTAKPVDVITSSLRMVRDGAAYILLIGHKYGQTPEDPRNPEGLSLTELEFNEAQRLGRPMLLFLMGENHSVKPADIEVDPEKRKKLEAFRGRAARWVYATFQSLEELKEQLGSAVAGLRRSLGDGEAAAVEARAEDPIPKPPAFYAEPPYIGSHSFVGRRSQMETLDDWARPADTHPVLLFDAIGGTGKSMLTWEWASRRAAEVRSDWAGRFWYSFYEREAQMADFCRRALAYMTQQPVESFREMKTREMTKLLLHQLQSKPWLVVLDGLERVLVMYNRIDAAEVADDAASKPTDEIGHRDPCSAIRPEDDDLLRMLAAAAPSKVLITSRLVPVVLLNAARQAIPGVLRVTLPGLRPADAEELLRSCGVTGNSRSIQDYLKSNCDCHPLVTGVLAGLIKGYLAARGDFDAWAASAEGGGRLNLAELDLVQKRNHILKAGLEALETDSRRLLSMLALLSEAVDYATLQALAPAPEKLTESVKELERRGLLQYDHQTRRYDLHPVVRGIAAGGLTQEEKEREGQRVVDHFSAKAHNPYEQARTMEDVRDGLRVVRTLLKMGKHRDAYPAYAGELSAALLFNLEACAEVLALLKPFFPEGWGVVPGTVDADAGSYLANEAANALFLTTEVDGALSAFGASLLADIQTAKWGALATGLLNIGVALMGKNRLANAYRCAFLSLDLAVLSDDDEAVFRARLECFCNLGLAGRWDEAKAMWKLLDPMGRNWSRARYRAGTAELCYATMNFLNGGLTDEHLSAAERQVWPSNDRRELRKLLSLRGVWHLERNEWKFAATSLQEAVHMARGVGQVDAQAETGLVIAKYQLGQLEDASDEANRLEREASVSDRWLAELWLAIGNRERAKNWALWAFQWACADGEPYVRRYELNKARALLETLGAEVPLVPVYDPKTDPKLPWEDEVRAAIEKLRVKKKVKQ